jgi:hypothetical protein
MKLHAAISEFFGALDSAARVAERYAVTDARLQTLGRPSKFNFG